MSDPVWEKLIRKNLEDSGELGKMRAMVIDAALKTLSKDQSAAANIFLPSPSLKIAKEATQGRQALSIVMDYLEHLGLTYTLSVLRQEAGLTDGTLEEKHSVLSALKLSGTTEPILSALVQTVGNDPAVVSAAKRGDGTANALTATTTTTNSATNVPPSTALAVTQAKIETGEDTTYFISKWTDRVFYRCGGQVSGQQVQLEYLTNCTVYVLDPLDSITVDDCEGGELIIAACEGSVFLRNCKNMTVHVACKQLRTRDCEHITLYLFASTDPVIEASHHMTFKPFHLRLPGLKSSFKATRLDPKENRFVHVYDFTEDDAKLPRPHFNVVYPNHGLSITDRCKEKGTPECPQEIEDLLAGRMVPASSSESGQNKSYNIKNGAYRWTGVATMPSDNDSDIRDAPESLLPLPSVSTGTLSRLEVPAAVEPVAARVTSALALRGEMSDASYSSFDDDDDDDNDDEDDELEVDEDSDDF